MSDPRTDFFSSGGDSAPDQDARTAFFASGIEKPPEPQLDNTWWGAIKGDADAALSLATHGVVGTVASIGRTINRVVPDWDNSRERTKADIDAAERALTYDPKTPEGQYALSQIGKVVSPITQGLSTATGNVVGKKNVPAVADAFNSLPLLGASKAIEAVRGGTAAEEYLRTVNAERDAALLAGQKEGYVVPPATTNPSLVNRGIEGVAGKRNVEQAASIKNQQVTNSLARRALDLPPDVPLTSETMGKLRDAAGKTYEQVKNAGTIQVSPQYAKDLAKITETADQINSDLPNYRSGASQPVLDLVSSLKPANGTFDARTAVELSKDLRFNANANWTAASRTGDPSLRTLSRAQSQAAEAVENEIERHLNSKGQGDLANAWDDARRTIAKTYSVENALDGAGNVDAAKIAKQSLKKKPLSPELQTAADFANAFPKATKLGASKESMPGISPLDVFAGTGMGETAHMLGADPAKAIALGVGVPAARVAARGMATSSVGQRFAVPPYLRRFMPEDVGR